MNKKQTSTFLLPSGPQVQRPRFRSHLPASRCLKVQFLYAFPSRVKNGNVVFQQWPRSSFPGKDKKGHSCVSGPRFLVSGPQTRVGKNVPQQWRQTRPSWFTSPWWWPQRGSITFPPVCRCRASERLGSYLFKTHLAHEPVVGPGFEAKVPGTRWLALNDPRHECTPMPFQRTANTRILSKFVQRGTWSWTKTHLEITQLKSREAEDCLRPPSGALKLCFQWKLCFLSFIH